ncbi:response regulator [Janthinobacterium sp. 17J80-10]|uniref:response regulator n=1 Tax=Janthinobacterium sp. 17J80-10 TaxID=2497863 RepID=UPI0010052B03|nr:response regulator [Janthinobacterium sp. 17J80-10]QAU33431.1 hybrid sensor histidine kinase/response regulator [Janthinobacterium sp. 17J80-10]
MTNHDYLEHVPTVLVVNDDPGSLLGLVALLSQWQEELAFKVISARSGAEALKQVLLHDFAVILLDVNMPGMNGFETAEAIHSRKASASTPIIFLTAYLADEMNRLRGYEQGAVDYLFTPIIPQILKAKLSVFVGLARKKLELKSQASILDKRTQELTTINALLEAEIDKRKTAEHKNKTTEEFLAMLGHELRNPLSAINGAAILLSLDGIGQQQTIAAKEIIRRQSTQLTSIVDDLLDLSRVMLGKISLTRRPTNFAQIVHRCIETLTIAGRTRHHTLTVVADEVHIEADATRIEQVVTNLLDNALKYTPNGGEIHVELRAAGDEAMLSVSDSGIGMSPDLLTRIFDIFSQGERSLDRPQGGLGIGLSLVRQLVLLHDGDVTADSQGSGTGSRFTIRLPRSEEVTSNLATLRPNSPAATYSILLIEDNDDARSIMAAMLSTLGHRTLTAANGACGIEIAAAELPDIVLIDIGMPDMNGYEVAQKLRAMPKTCALKLIALTGYGLADDKVKAIEAGFDMHLVKPVSLDALNNAFNQCLSTSAA